MRIEVTKLTDVSLMQKACEFTINQKSKMSLLKIYQCEHSPMRTQLFWVEMYDIPTFISVHFRTHSIGVTHYVKSNREDRPGFTGDEGRMQPVNHAMLINAQELINIARKRLCSKAHKLTHDVMWEMCRQVGTVDEELLPYLVPECEYRNGCHELKPCGRYELEKGNW